VVAGGGWYLNTLVSTTNVPARPQRDPSSRNTANTTSASGCVRYCCIAKHLSPTQSNRELTAVDVDELFPEAEELACQGETHN